MNEEMIIPQHKLREFEEIQIPMPWGHVAGRWYGKTNTRPILAMHGWLDNQGTWDTLIPLMPPHIGVIAIDLPGHGESSRLPNGIVYHAHTYMTVIIRVMHHYNWNKISLMAHSMSSAIAFVFAACYPDRVDMLIQLDNFHPKYSSPEYIMYIYKTTIESFLLEEKRIHDKDFRHPPLYSYDDVIQRVHDGSNYSVDKDKCHHLIRTNAEKSTLYPSKYYFSRDPRLKAYVDFAFSIESMIAMAKCIKIPQLVIKASQSLSIDADNDPLLEVLRANNPYFEFHILEGTHHVHLNNAPETSVVVNRFINRWKQPQVDDSYGKDYDGNVDLSVGGVRVDGDGDLEKPQPQICPVKCQDLKVQRAKL